MSLGGRIAVWMAAATITLVGWSANAPMQVVFVQFDSPALFLLAGGDPDVAYTILEPPTQGTLVGIPPNLTYIPRPGFSGTDWVHYLVQTDTGQWDLGTVQLIVLSPGATMSPFVLTSEGEIVLSGPTFAVDSYKFIFGIQARFTYFEQGLRATWTQDGFTSFVGTTRTELEGTWPSPWRLPITSTLDFDPTIPGLNSWTLNATVNLLGATWAYTFYLSGTEPQTPSYSTFQVQGTVGPFTFDSRTKFVTLTPTFGEQRLVVKGPWICQGCPTNWELEFVQTKAGFDHLSFLIKDIEIPCPGCGSIQTFFDFKVTFTVEEKRIEPALRITSGWVACMKPFVSLATPTGGFGLEGIDLYGIDIKCEALGGYTLRLVTSFNPLKDAEVTGYAQFFELWQLEGPIVPCCGNPGRFQLSAYFKRETGTIFGFGMGNLILYFPISREVLVNVGLKFGEADPFDLNKTWILTTGWKGLF